MLLSDINNIVNTGALDDLIGEIEGQFFDAKGQPYLFDGGLDVKREFAKDVASFANAAGGCIFIGVATKTSVVMAGEEVEALRPVPHTLFDPDQHQKILFDWLYPVPKDLVIKWIQWGNDHDKGIGIIFVPEQDERNKPFLIKRSMGDKKAFEVLLGYAERRLDTTEVRSVAEIHLALRTGFNLERELMGRIENLEILIEKHFSIQKEAQGTENRNETFKKRIESLLNPELARL
jgi:hypothetical protein